MREVLTDIDEEAKRTQIHIGIAFPSVVVLFIICLFVTAKLEIEVFWVVYIPVFINFILTCFWVRRLWRFLRRLKGKEKEEFLRLYRYLHDRSAVDDISEIAITIDHMAALVEWPYGEVRDFVLRYAGKFLINATSVPLRIPSSQILTDTLQVLRSDLKDLPEYLSHGDPWIRDAASRRLIGG